MHASLMLSVIGTMTGQNRLNGWSKWCASWPRVRSNAHACIPYHFHR